MDFAPACAHERDARSSRAGVGAAGPSSQLDTLTPIQLDRLRDGRDIASVLRGRHQRSGHLIAVHVADRAVDDPPRVAVVASRRVGNAVARNRAKRLLREAARDVPFRPGIDVVLVARAACAGSGFGAVRDELNDLGERLGVVDAQDAA